MSEAPREASNQGRLVGRRILVVGAGTQTSDDPDAPIGNGRAISIRCAREGASVVCLDRDLGASRETLAMIEADGGNGFAIEADVTSAEACAKAVGHATELLGGLDGLVLNVGTGLGSGLRHTSADQWDQTFAVNVRSHFLLCQAASTRCQRRLAPDLPRRWSSCRRWPVSSQAVASLHTTRRKRRWRDSVGTSPPRGRATKFEPTSSPRASSTLPWVDWPPLVVPVEVRHRYRWGARAPRGRWPASLPFCCRTTQVT